MLAEHAKFVEQSLKDKNGRTPVELCARAAAPCRELPEMMRKVMDEHRPEDRPEDAKGAMNKPAGKKGGGPPKTSMLGGRGKYKVAPDAPEEASGAEATWREKAADKAVETVLRNASPPIVRGPPQAVAGA